jgi:DNA-binding transcriptional LysR family regulator
MDTFHLRAFVAVSRERNVGKAAESLRLTPSPVSRIIRELERQLGGELFTRSYHDMSLTPLGERLLPMAVDFIARGSAMEELQSGKPPRLRMGATPWAPHRVASQVTSVAREVMGTEPEITSDVSSALLNLLRHGDLDFAFVHLPVELPGIDSMPLAEYQFVVIADRADALARQASVTTKQLADREVAMMPLSMQPAPMNALVSHLRDAGVATLNQVELKDVIGLGARIHRTGEVMLGLSAADSPLNGLVSTGELTMIPLTDGPAGFFMGVAWRHDDARLSEQIDAILAALRPDPEAALPLVS